MGGANSTKAKTELLPCQHELMESKKKNRISLNSNQSKITGLQKMKRECYHPIVPKFVAFTEIKKDQHCHVLLLFKLRIFLNNSRYHFF